MENRNEETKNLERKHRYARDLDGSGWRSEGLGRGTVKRLQEPREPASAQAFPDVSKIGCPGRWRAETRTGTARCPGPGSFRDWEPERVTGTSC